MAQKRSANGDIIFFFYSNADENSTVSLSTLRLEETTSGRLVRWHYRLSLVISASCTDLRIWRFKSIKFYNDRTREIQYFQGRHHLDDNKVYWSTKHNLIRGLQYSYRSRWISYYLAQHNLFLMSSWSEFLSILRYIHTCIYWDEAFSLFWEGGGYHVLKVLNYCMSTLTCENKLELIN